jgi:hypothetical protein
LLFLWDSLGKRMDGRELLWRMADAYELWTFLIILNEYIETQAGERKYK